MVEAQLFIWAKEGEPRVRRWQSSVGQRVSRARTDLWPSLSTGPTPSKTGCDLDWDHRVQAPRPREESAGGKNRKHGICVLNRNVAATASAPATYKVLHKTCDAVESRLQTKCGNPGPQCPGHPCPVTSECLGQAGHRCLGSSQVTTAEKQGPRCRPGTH